MNDSINLLVEKELKRSQDLYEEYFPRTQYAYGVILEELEETEEDIRSCQAYTAKLWRCVRQKEQCKRLTVSALQQLSMSAKETAQEAIQLAAMAEKLLRGIDEGITVVG